MLYYKIIYKFFVEEDTHIYLCTAPTTRDAIQMLKMKYRKEFVVVDKVNILTKVQYFDEHLEQIKDYHIGEI